MNRQRPLPEILWVTPPDDFALDDIPVKHTGQPLIAGALRESLELLEGDIPDIVMEFLSASEGGEYSILA